MSETGGSPTWQPSDDLEGRDPPGALPLQGERERNEDDVIDDLLPLDYDGDSPFEGSGDDRSLLEGSGDDRSLLEGIGDPQESGNPSVDRPQAQVSLYICVPGPDSNSQSR